MPKSGREAEWREARTRRILATMPEIAVDASRNA